MFSTKFRGLSEPCYVMLVVLGLGCSYAIGRPQDNAKVHVRAPNGQSGPALRFSPELLLENTLESAASPASIYPHFPPSALSRSQSPATTNDNINREQSNNKGNNLDNTNDISFVNSNPDSPGANSAHANDNGQGIISTTDLKGNGLQSGPRFDGFHDSYRAGGGTSGERPQPQGIPRPMPDPASRGQPPVNQLKDSTGLNVGNSPPREPARQNSLGLTETRQQSAPHRSVYPSVSNPANISPQIHEDLDVDGLNGAGKVPSSSEEDLGLPPLLRAPPPPPRPFQPSVNKATVSDGVPAKAIPWQQVLSSDVDVDRPIIQQTGQKKIPDEEERFPSLPSVHHDDLSEDSVDLEPELDLDSDENPFRDEDDIEDEVPLELALQVIQAMKEEPAWKKYIGSGWEEMEPYWEDDEYEYDEDEEYYDEEEESDEYDDWIPAGNMSPQNSRLITLIIETIGVTEREDTRDSDMDIWQILNNFPFPMLLGKQNVDDDDFYSEEYDEDEYDDEYDDDEYYDDEDSYDEDEYDEDEYDDDEYDDDEYDEDEYDDDEEDEDDEDDLKFAVSLEEDRMRYLKDENDNESDEELDDCDDGEPCNDDVNVMRKEDFSLFSLVQPLITKK